MFNIEYKVVEELTLGDSQYQLAESPKGNQVIRTWSTLSKKWNVLYKTSVAKHWDALVKLKAKKG